MSRVDGAWQQQVFELLDNTEKVVCELLEVPDPYRTEESHNVMLLNVLDTSQYQSITSVDLENIIRAYFQIGDTMPTVDLVVLYLRVPQPVTINVTASRLKPLIAQVGSQSSIPLPSAVVINAVGGHLQSGNNLIRQLKDLDIEVVLKTVANIEGLLDTIEGLVLSHSEGGEA